MQELQAIVQFHEKIIENENFELFNLYFVGDIRFWRLFDNI